jgi:hypothetical protein
LRLIDADKLLDALDKIEQDYENVCIMPNWYTAIGEIKQQPTAYDVNKVVEKLKSEKKVISCVDNEFQRGTKNGNNYALNMAIEIVKRGGKNE